MKLKIAKQHLDDKSANETVTLKDILNGLKEKGSAIYYFDNETPHKDLVDLVEKLEEKDHSVYLEEVKYGLDENDYIYEMHIL